MQDLWGELLSAPTGKQKTSTTTEGTTVSLTSQDCLLFGHSWTPAGMSGEKLCTTCGVKGYCPVCTPLNKSPDATPFLCNTHSEGTIQA